MKSKLFALFLVVLMALSMSACYINEEVNASQVAAQIDGGKIDNIVGPGIYTKWGPFQDLKQVNVGAVTFSVEDPEVLTLDNQAIGVRITIQAKRNSDKDSITNLLTNWPALIEDESLVNTVSATAREGLKNGVRQYTLMQLLDDRNGLADKIVTQLEEDASKYGVQIINVTIENVSADKSYMDLLQQKANYEAQIAAEKKRQDLIRQQADNDILQQQQTTTVLKERLIAEKALTDVQVEIGSRDGKVIAEQNKVYKDNPQAYELARLEKLAKVVGSNAKFYFIPQGMNMTMLLSGLTDQSIVPVAPVAPVAPAP